MKYIKHFFHDIQIYKYMIKKYNGSNQFTLGRWSSSVDKKKWEKYADFANYDNCCCSGSKSKNTSKMNIHYVYIK